MSTTSEVKYYEDGLVIKIQTATPENLHALMLRGLIVSLKNCLLMEDRTDEDVDGLVALANVLQKISPTEVHLQKAYELHKSPAA